MPDPFELITERFGALSEFERTRYVAEFLDGMLGEHFNLSLRISKEAYDSLGDGELDMIETIMVNAHRQVEELINVERIESE